MKTKWMGALLLLLAAPLLAQPNAPPDAQQDADRAVARVSLMNGNVTSQRGDSGDWIAATVNAPLVTGDRVYAAGASRAEVQFDYADFLRLGENTEVRLADLENRRYQLQVSKGILTYSIQRDMPADVEIDTPAVAVHPLQKGVYRVQVLDNGETEITVRDGRAEISSRQGTETLDRGRTMVVRMGATDSDIQVQVVEAAPQDDWDRWNAQRDQQLGRSVSARYVNPSVYGVEDLDAYGSWSTTPDYGPVWYPRVAAGWTPYSYGRWVWEPWYGWTWVDYDPWGWAPFHYGRWFFRGGFGWGWCPGPVGVFSPWSPALVGFFGFGRHVGVGVGFGFGNIGWVPLAPGELIHPWWGRGFAGNRTVINNVNITNVTNVTNIRNVYRNAGVNGGVRAINAQNFGQGNVINHQAVNANQIQNAGQIRGMVPVAPTSNSLRVSNRAVTPNMLPRAEARQEHFFATRQPPAVQPNSFGQQQQQVQRSIRAGATSNGSRALEAAAPGAGAGNRTFGTAGAASPATANTRTGIAAASNAPAGAAAANNGQAGPGRGWRRLGQTSQAAPAAAGRGAPAAQQGVNNNRSVDRASGSSGWRVTGGETPSPGSRPSVSPSTAAPNNGWRQFGQPGMQAAPAAPRMRSSEPPPAARPAPESPRGLPSPSYGGRSQSNNFHSMGGGQRQLQIHQPIIMERAPSGGGSRMSAPARSESRSSGGGGRMSAPARSESRGSSGGGSHRR
ncbi:MAG TPA: DUF6600 domain-containing protein [Bryobacterales bacterium]|nr:DUF6600 domain-containing protein [Bryobacterales bacterium]